MQTGFSQFLVNQNEFWGIYLESRLFAEFPVDYFLGEVRPLKVLVEVEYRKKKQSKGGLHGVDPSLDATTRLGDRGACD